MTVRLRVLDDGQRPIRRILIWILRAIAGTDDAVAKTSLYRPGFFGRPWLRFVHSSMRGQSEWSSADRELFAALISRLNSCPFCVTVHVAIANLTTNTKITAEMLDSWRSMKLTPQVAATLALLEKLTLAPDQVGPADMAQVRQAGVSDAALVDALHVCFLFNTINRLANAFGYDWGSDANALKGAAILNRIGYRMPEIFLK